MDSFDDYDYVICNRYIPSIVRRMVYITEKNKSYVSGKHVFMSKSKINGKVAYIYNDPALKKRFLISEKILNELMENGDN